jgi:DNA-binding CsgD family transcriptional regulator/catechol 2,3-dioxygenase-like lactoylglutathione lyase family enzyme
MRRTRRPRGRPPHPDILTPAEWRVANAVRHGMTNQEISRRLRVSSDAVKYHLANILAKLSLPERRALRRWAGAPADSALHRQGAIVNAELTLGPIGQVSRQVSDIPRAVQWYTTVLGLPHLYTYGDLAFFDCGGTRLFLTSRKDESSAGQSILYFSTPNIAATYEALVARGVTFRGAPHLIHRHDSGVEEWMAFFDDLDGQPLALMSQVKPRDNRL